MTDPVGPRLLTGLARIGVALKADAWRTTQPSGLTPTQLQTLSLLRARGPSRAGAIADGLSVRPPTVSDVLSTLVQKGLVARLPDPEDGRATRVVLTAAGEAQLAALGAWPDVMLEAVDTLDPAEQGVMLRALSKMIVRLQERGRIDVARVCLTCTFFRPDAHSNRRAPHHCAFVDRPFGDRNLQVDCPDHQPGVLP